MSQAAVSSEETETPEQNAPLRIEDATIALVPHTKAGCIDLGLMFCGQNIVRILKLWALFAIPCCAFVYYMGYWYETQLRLAIAVTFFATAIMGVMLISAAAPAAFGAKFTFSQMLQPTGKKFKQILRALVWRCVIALGIGLVLYPPEEGETLFRLLGLILMLFAHWVAARTGFGPEVAWLSELESSPDKERADKLIKRQTGDQYLALLVLLTFYLILIVVLFTTVDMALEQMVQSPVLIGKAIGLMGDVGAEDGMDLFLELLWNDPLVSTVLTAVALFVYPITRMAWFFSYIDLRVRHDCWDLELLMLEESKRLESTT